MFTLEIFFFSFWCDYSVECNENILDKRTADVSKLLSMLRSVSIMTDASSSSSHGDWKVCFVVVLKTSDTFLIWTTDLGL